MRVNHHYLHLATTPRPAEEWEAVERVGMDNKEGFGCALPGGCWPGEALGELTRSKTSDVIGWGYIFGFLCMILNWKQGQKLGMLSVIN